MLELKNISLSVEDEFTGNGQKEILRDVSPVSYTHLDVYKRQVSDKD